MIKGVTFDMQSPTAKNHGALFAGLLTDGILNGCEITSAGKACYIGPGYIMIAGRLVQVSSTETVNIAATSGYANIVLNVDLSQEATRQSFGQAYFSVVNSDSATDPALTQNDVNDNGLLYQILIAKYAANSNSITLQKTYPKARSSAKMVGTVYSSVPTDLSGFEEGELILVG